MIKFFNIEDFPTSSVNGVWSLTSEAVAYIANAKLEREGKVVYTYKTDPAQLSSWNYSSLGNNNYKALLINIEPIEKCKHPAEKVKQWSASRDTNWQMQNQNFIQTNNLPEDFYICECGATVVPESFKEKA